MDPRVVAATEQEVLVLWHQRGLNPVGQRLDMETLGVYGVRDGKFARAQMFYFDTTAVLRFLQEPRWPRFPGLQRDPLLITIWTRSWLSCGPHVRPDARRHQSGQRPVAARGWQAGSPVRPARRAIGRCGHRCWVARRRCSPPSGHRTRRR
jgi:hypothetical protein